jgi:tRNA-specific 2-thiouridylase
LAKKFNLPTSEKKDSQGLCFVGKVDFLDFLSQKLPQKIGAILNSDGEKIGEHIGAHFFTIGQRHGLGFGGQANPFFVAEKDVSTNTITVASQKDEALYKSEVLLESINWISGIEPTLPLNCFARIRYRQELQKAVLYENKIVFDVQQRAVAVGQSIVFYTKRNSSNSSGSKSEDFEMLGGGIIRGGC